MTWARNNPIIGNQEERPVAAGFAVEVVMCKLLVSAVFQRAA